MTTAVHWGLDPWSHIDFEGAPRGLYDFGPCMWIGWIAGTPVVNHRVIHVTRTTRPNATRAQWLVGRQYYEGTDGKAVDKCKALELWFAAAASNNADAVHSIGRHMIQNGDYKGGVIWLERAVRLGSLDAIYSLGKYWLTRSNAGTPELLKAFHYFFMGTMEGHLESLCGLVACYSEGWGVPKNELLAQELTTCASYMK